MIKLITILALLFSTLANAQCGNIIRTNEIADILPLVDDETIVLFDMDDTLTDSTISLGTGAWRQYIRKKIAEYEKQKEYSWKGKNLHDVLAFYVALHVPVKPVQEETLTIIEKLQKKKIPTFVLTGRGKVKWYSTDIPGTDRLTLHQLRSAGYRFQTSDNFDKVSDFAEGVFFTSGKDKGDFLDEDVFPVMNSHFSKIVFVDDKLDQVESVLTRIGNIKAVTGVYYSRAQSEHKDFDPVVATIQLQQLLDHNKVLTDKEALEIKSKMGQVDPDAYFFKFLDHLDISKIKLN